MAGSAASIPLLVSPSLESSQIFARFLWMAKLSLNRYPLPLPTEPRRLYAVKRLDFFL